MFRAIVRCWVKFPCAAEPDIRQILLGSDLNQDELERKLYIIRKRTERIIRDSGLKQKNFFYIPSLSTKVLVYKGMLTSMQLGEYFLDLKDERLQSAIALVHSRFSTNTFPSWDLAQPFRMLGHNGEINTIKGNRFWMEARESILKSDKLGDLSDIYPIIEPDKSDSASLDNVLEFLLMSGKSLPYAMSILIPESIKCKKSYFPRTEGFLSLSFHFHGTMGRTGITYFFRRQIYRRDARQERSSSIKICDNNKRPDCDGIRSRSTEICP